MATTFKNAVLESKLTCNMELGGDNVAGQKAVIDDLNETLVIDSGSTPDGAYALTDNKTLTGGTDTILLFNGIADLEGNTITLTGQKVRAIKFQCPTTNNAGGVTITYGASNPYLLLGTAWKMILTPGMSVLVYCENDAVTLDATHTQIDVTGTAADVLKWVAVFG
jgi:hypothetical protein